MQTSSIIYAINRFKDFVRVQKNNDRDVRLEGVDNFALGAGMDARSWETLTEELDEIVECTGGELGWAIIGFLMGLYAAEAEREACEDSNRAAGF